MKKFIVAAVLAIVLSFSLVVPAFAETPVRIIGSYYYYPYSGWSGSGFGGGTHTVEPSTKTLTKEDFLSLYYGAVESNSNSYSFSLRRNGSYTFIYVLSPSTTKALGLLCNQKGTVYRCSSTVHSELYLISSIIDYIDQIEGRLARTVGDTVYTVADSTYNTWQTLKGMSGTIEKIAGRLLNYTDDGVGHTVAESSYWGYQKTIDIYNRLGNISGYVDQIEDRLLVYSSDGIAHTVAESSYWGYQKTIDIYSRLGSTNSKLDSIFSSVDNLDKSPVSSYDDTVLINKLTSIESALSNLGNDVTTSVEEVTNIEISVDNDARNVFFVEDENGDKSIVDLSKDGLSVFGKLMNFLYQAMFKDALSDSASGIDGLYDFYMDNSEGVDVWAS